MNLATSVVAGLGSVFGQFFLIFFTVVFLLLEGSSLPGKLNAALENSDATLARFTEFAQTVQRYLAIKTVVSLITGLIVTVWVYVLGLDFPILWGIVAFLFNYVPNIGSIIAAVPAVLLALVQFGIGKALVVALGYIVVNVIMGNFVEPRVMGRGLGLSPLVVFLSLIFWGWLFGPVGMLLSVPLTMIVKIAFQHSPEMRWLAVLLGPPISESTKAEDEPRTASS
jgi:predicted PurR-regulated permease PerM